MAELAVEGDTQIIQRTQRERVQFQWKEYRGNWYLDIRVFFLPKGEDDWQATRKGVSFKEDDLQLVGTALQEVFKAKPKEPVPQ